MLFNSLVFLFGFLPWAVLGFWLLSRHENARLWFLLAASFVFYGYWDWRFAPLLAGSIIFNWLVAKSFYTYRRRWVLTAAIVANLLVLGLFKYLGFFSEIVRQTISWQGDFKRLALPLGISFFTFHNIIYLADLYRGRAPRYSFRDYALYIALFPQILAGPLVRHNEIVPQLPLPPARPGAAERLARGLAFLLIGLSKKIFLADALAAFVDPVFAQAATDPVTTGQAWIAALGFPLQIYFDFSGYSDMAIGIALMLGFTLPFNFDAPYRAVTLAQFWRRWHMTLMRFLRDYVYIPLGGNRRGDARRCLNVIVTFLLGGLWHGAGWTFILWGALHGIGLAVGVLWRKFMKPLPAALSWPILIAFLILTWIFFRARSMEAAQHFLTAMAGQGTHEAMSNVRTLLIACAFALIGPSSQQLVAKLKPAPWLAPFAAAVTAVALFKINGNPSYEFIYFHF
jgi:D-alanyl-lipoteichoic acid acyltransferase DltB (MBOAT superfamily)